MLNGDTNLTVLHVDILFRVLLYDPTWRILWKLAVPAKVKIHSWRIMHGVILLKAILFRRHIGTSDLYPICNLEAEDTMHMLFKYQRVAQIWEGLGLTELIERATNDGRSGAHGLEFILKSSQVAVSGYNVLKIQELVAVGCWYIWWLRRRQSHGEQVPPVRHCINFITAITSNSGKATTPESSVKKHVWLKPCPRNLKLNVDAAFSIETQSGAIGAVIHDCQGNFVAAINEFILHVYSAAMAEAMAMLHGLSLVNQIGCSSVEVESDSIEVIQISTGENRMWNEASAIYSDILAQAANIGTVEFSHCRRDTNTVAHDLARDSFISRSCCNWIDDPPSFILLALLNDVTVL
jgi:ribonuclease HI